VIEVHPEMSFAQLAGGVPLAEPKKTWAGAERRRTLLAEAGITFTEPLGEAGLRAGVDDVLDAAAAAWTARRHLAGHATPLPNPPELLDGRDTAIWR
jgi:predicted RNase H-like nuclease